MNRCSKRQTALMVSTLLMIPVAQAATTNSGLASAKIRFGKN